MSITLFCLVKGNTTANAFEVNIEKDKSISHLKEVIKEEKQNDFAGVDANKLTLWKVEIPDDRDDSLRILTLQDQDKLRATIDIGDYWTEEPPKRHVHVLVEPPEVTALNEEIEILRGQVAALKLGHELGYVPPAEIPRSASYTELIKRIKREQEYKETVELGLKANPPSTGAKPSNFFLAQQKNPILNGRPLELTGPPITIYNRAFGQFLENFNNVNLEIPPDILEWVIEIISAAADRYAIEGERMKKMREILGKKFGTISLISYGKGYQSDGTITTKADLLDAYTGIFEGKNEVGSGGTDPSFQGALYYRDYWSQLSANRIRDCCCAPSIVITIAGPWFCVLGGIFLNRIVVQALTDCISLTIDLRRKDQVNRIARLFQALRIAFKQLGYFYQNLDLNQKAEQRYFPYLRSFKFTSGNNINFTYIEELADGHTRTIWKACTTNTNEKVMIVVKFATEYNVEAHRICCERGYAPRIRYCSTDNEIRALGGYRMVIMDYFGISMDQKLINGSINPNNSIYEDINNAIDLLHSRGYVFADLRQPNILLYEKNGLQRAMLIDFDWCGKNGIDKYPPSLNMMIEWPSDVKPGTVLKEEHDTYWLGKLQEFLIKLPNTLLD